ncbi:MAG: hypothetical protein ABUK01_05230 [Leptospirales bacterium]
MKNLKTPVIMFLVIILSAGYGKIIAKKAEGHKYTVAGNVIFNSCQEEFSVKHNGIWMVEINRKSGRIFLPGNNYVSLEYKRKGKYFISTEQYTEQYKKDIEIGLFCKNELFRKFTRIRVDENELNELNELNAVEKITINSKRGVRTCIKPELLPCVIKVEYNGSLLEKYTPLDDPF